MVEKDTSSPLLNPCAVRFTKSPASVKVTARPVVRPVLVPVTCMPADNPVVLAIVIVVEPAAGVPVNETGVGAPQLFVNVNVLVAPAAAVPKFVNIVSNASLERLQSAKVTVYLMLVKFIAAKLGAFKNMLVKSVTAFKLIVGTLTKL